MDFLPLHESCFSFQPERTEFNNKVLAGLQGGFNHLYSQGLLFDLTVAIGEDTFECHRFMLAAASDFFKASLTSSWCESSSRLVRLDHSDVTTDSFRLLLDILYKGKDVVTMTTARKILKMAIFLQIKFLQDDVEKYLSDNMNTDTCIGIWQFAELYDLKQLAQKAADLAVNQFALVSICEEFLDIRKTFLLILLSSVTSSTFTSTKLSENARQMDCLFYAILRWVEADADSRKTHLAELLPFVCFPQLTPGCLDKAVAYLNHPFRDVMFDYVEEALSYKLTGKMEENKAVQRQILARQNKLIECPDIQRHVVLVGGEGGASDTKTMLELTSFPVGSEDSPLYRLKSAPDGLRVNFATCVWKNELYVSGGFDQSRLFAVYKPGDNQWDILPQMLKGREKHCMAALNWNVYVIGGLEQGCLVEKSPASDVVVYSVKKKTWTHFGRLAVAVSDTTAAVLGHRIYVFGGQDARGKNTDMVQCIDTLSGHVYTAGCLPAPSSGARAVSDGGTIYIATAQGKVLEMKENFVLADEREREARVLCEVSSADVEGKEKSTKDCDEQQAQSHDDTNNLQEEKEEGAPSYKPEKSGPVSLGKASDVSAADVSDKPSPTVGFDEVGRFPARHDFGAYVHDGELVVCGGKRHPFSTIPCHDQMGVHQKRGKLSHKQQTLVNGRSGFGVHVLYVPEEFLVEECTYSQGTMRFSFEPALTNTSLSSNRKTIGKFQWYWNVRLEEPHLQLYLHMVTDRKRNEHVNTHFTAKLVPTNEIFEIADSLDYVFSDQKGSGYGWPTFEPLETLRFPWHPYLHDGKAMIEYTISVGSTHTN